MLWDYKNIYQPYKGEVMENFLDLKKLNTFVKIAESGSFYKASIMLGYSPAAVSIQIQQLEFDLGMRLFDRLGKQVRLTDHGKQFYPYAEKILMLNEEAKESLIRTDDMLTGELRIGTIDSICDTLFPQVLAEFYEKNPNVTVEVRVCTPSELFEGIKHNNIDIMLLLDKPSVSRDFVADVQIETEVVFCASRNHPLAYKNEIELSEILEYPCILTEKNANYRYILESKLSELGLSIKPSIESQNTNLIIKLLCNNMGYSVLPRFLIEPKLRDDTLKVLPIKDFHIKANYQVLHKKDRFINRQMESFIKMLEKQAGILQVSNPQG